MNRSRYGGSSDQIQGNTAVVNPGDALQAAYDRLKSSASDGAMGALSVTNQRYLILSPGTYTDNLAMDTAYVNVVGIGNSLVNMEGTITNTATNKAAYVNLNDFDPYTAKSWEPRNEYKADDLLFELNFEDKTDAAYFFAAGTAVDSTDFFTYGVGGMKMTGAAAVAKTFNWNYEFAAPINMTTATVRLRYYVASRAGLQSTDSLSPMTLILSSDVPNTLTNFFTIARMPAREGQWHDIEFTTSELLVGGGAPNIASIAGFWVQSDASVGQEGGAEIYFDRLEIYDNDIVANPKAKIVIGLDDGHDSQLPALKYAAGQGIRTYCCVASDQIGEANYMTWAEIEELYGTGLVNMYNHYFIPLYEQGNYALQWYAMKSKTDLISHGISNADANVLVMPTGTAGLTDKRPVPDNLLELSKYFTKIRGTQQNWTGCGDNQEAGQTAGGSTFENGDQFSEAYIPLSRHQRWWTYGRQMVTAGSLGDPDDIATWIAAAKANGGVLSLYAHLGATNDITLTEWKAVIDAIKTAVDAGDAEVVSLNDI